ncbi:helix-turn-helix transcriptional regulator [Sagittula marina]
MSAVSRAIAGSQSLRIRYVSLSTGATDRIVSPHALVDSGLRWHMRAHDERRDGFRDFVLTRIQQAEVIGPIPTSANRELDEQWMRIVPMELVPHPDLEQPLAVVADYGMTRGVLQLRLRASLVGYVTQFWGIDTTSDHSLDPMRHQLWLRNTATLYGVESLEFAPGTKILG